LLPVVDCIGGFAICDANPFGVLRGAGRHQVRRFRDWLTTRGTNDGNTASSDPVS
jgi:hypothetical protein